MKHCKRILSFLLMVVMALGMLLIPSHAELEQNLEIATIGGAKGIFEVLQPTGWEDLPVPFWASLETSSLAYCLESDRDQPKGDGYSVTQAFYNSKTLTGIQAILLHGAPNDMGGLTTVQACYATQVAIWCWMYESAGVGLYLYQPSRLRPASGNQAVYDYFLSLLDKAQKGNLSVNHGVSVTPSTITLTDNGQGQLVGTATVKFTNLNGNYAIDPSKVPAGVTIQGSSYKDGDTITITAPMSYAGQTISMKGIVVAHDTRDPANVFWYESDAKDLQKMVVFDYTLQPVLWTDLSFTSQGYGHLDIIKTVANGGSLAGFQFEVRNSSNTLNGTYTTDANGKIHIPNLMPGTYSVKEVNLPVDYVTPDNNPRQVTVIAGQTTTLNWENTKKQGIITVQKRNADPESGDYSLSGAVFEIRSGTSLVDTVTTDDSGKAQSKPLPLGSYVVSEKTAPTGFLRNTQTFNVTISGSQGSASVVYAPEVTVLEQPQQGRINLRKTNSNAAMGDYSLAGAVFDILDVDGNVVDTLATDAKGEAQSRLLRLGGYTVRERMAPYGFVLNTSSFTANLVYAGQDVNCAYVTVNVPERPQTGIIRLTKSNINPSMGDYALTGAVFEVRNASGTLVDTITTNAAGLAQSKELPLGTYTVTEKTAPYGFVRNNNSFNVSLIYAGQSVAITYGDVAVGERPQTGKITVTKRDTVTGDAAQGDATLNGAVFEILASDQKTVVDTIYCGADNKATSKELPLGTYYIKEKTPPVGYTLDTVAHKIVIAYGDQDVEVMLVDGEVKNKVIEGQVAIVKHSDQAMEGYDDPQIEQPLEGAVFEVFLKASGSYANAKDSERDRLETNENGYALSKKLPFGVYTIQEVSAPGDVKLVEPFDVFISTEGRIYRFILNDPAYNARVKIVKLDDSTSKVIPAAGTSFKIKDLKTGEWVKQEVWYPTPATIDVFETGPDGTLMLPEPLYSGDYELHEVQAPYGYLLSQTPVKFSINSEQQEAVVTVTMRNQPVMGKITVEKQGEALVGAEEINTAWGKQLVPVFGIKPLIGAEFNIIAAEDIVTPDGTVRAKKGDVVDRIVTGDKGTATSKALYLGNYYAVEIKAPAGFVLDATPHSVSLVYENQLTAVVSSQIGVDDVRQKVEISLNKVMEKPVGAPDDYSAFHDVVFGLFAGEDFDVIIPKDALIATITLDESGKGVFLGDLPFGKFYVKELQTNSYYQLNTTAYSIDVPYAGQDNAVSRVQINNGGAIPNELKLGKIKIEKQGEIFVDAKKTADGYTPIYELRGLPGATFDIIAAEDMYDVSGKLLIKKGTVVDTVTTGKDGRAESKELRLGRYEVVETAAPAGFVLDTARHAITLDFAGQVEEVVTKQATVLNERYRAEIRIKKLWEVPSNATAEFAPWKEITFGLYAKNDILAADGSVAIPAGALVETIGIDKDGNGKALTDLPYGAYYVQELTTAKGYVLDDQRHELRFESADEYLTILSISAENKIQRGSLKIIKTFEGKDTPIAGVPFTIVGQTAFGEISIEAKTDKNGEILLEGLPVGKYTVTELESDLTKGYALSPAQTATVAANKIADMKIHNKLQRGALKVIKTFEGRTKPIEGVDFLIVGQTVNGDVRYEVKTDKNGEIQLENLPVGTYTVTEVRSDLNAGYVLAVAQTVAIESGKTAELKIENKLQRGSLKIVKTFEGLDKPMEGVPFTIVGKTVNGEVRYEAKTDKNGEIILKDLPVGTYTVTEKKAGITSSYVLAPTQTVTITAGKETTLRITNQLAKGEIRVLKLDKETGKHLEGAMFGLYKGGKLIAEAKSGKDGYAVFKDVAFGEYEIRELSAPTGYMRSEEVLKAIVGKDGSVVLLKVTNERIPGEPVQPEEPEVPVGPKAPLPKTGDSKTIVVVALVVLIIAGGAVLWLRKRGKDEEETTEEEQA